MDSVMLKLVVLAAIITVIAGVSPKGPTKIFDTRNVDTDEPQPPGWEPAGDGPHPPGWEPAAGPVANPEAGPVANPEARMGMRCPFPPNVDGTFPDFCYDIIGARCECLFDDIVVSQRECVMDNSTLYEELLTNQWNVERQRDVRRAEMGLPVRTEAYEHLMRCKNNLHVIISLSKISEN